MEAESDAYLGSGVNRGVGPNQTRTRAVSLVDIARGHVKSGDGGCIQQLSRYKPVLSTHCRRTEYEHDTLQLPRGFVPGT
jgi:hypothetical protein